MDLLLHHADTKGKAQMHTRPVPKQHFNKKHIRNMLLSFCLCIAILGCDTTSRIMAWASKVALANICNEGLSDIAGVFMEEAADKVAIHVVHVEEKALIIMYNGDPNITLGQLRYKSLLKRSTGLLPNSRLERDADQIIQSIGMAGGGQETNASEI